MMLRLSLTKKDIELSADTAKKNFFEVITKEVANDNH